MAGLIAAHGHNGGRDGVVGMAPKAKIFPVKADSDRERGDAAVIAAAIDAAVQHGVRVISMSFGHTESSLLREAVTRALRADVVLVAGVGNRPVDDAISWPARYEGVAAVAAVDRNGNHADISVTGRQVLVAAPGVDIESAANGNQYRTGTGTSDATAITAGVVALIRSKYPTLSATEVIHRLTATATDKGPKGRDDEYGYGIINPYAALTADIPPLAASTAPTGALPTIPETQPPTKKTSPVPIVIAAIAATAVLVAILLTLARRRSSKTN
jgi:subtilisin family serine protease